MKTTSTIQSDKNSVTFTQSGVVIPECVPPALFGAFERYAQKLGDAINTNVCNPSDCVCSTLNVPLDLDSRIIEGLLRLCKKFEIDCVHAVHNNSATFIF